MWLHSAHSIERNGEKCLAFVVVFRFSCLRRTLCTCRRKSNSYMYEHSSLFPLLALSTHKKLEQKNVPFLLCFIFTSINRLWLFIRYFYALDIAIKRRPWRVHIDKTTHRNSSFLLPRTLTSKRRDGEQDPHLTYGTPTYSVSPQT